MTHEPDLVSLPAYAQERWPGALERAHAKVGAVTPNPAADKLLQAAQRAATTRQRVVWLQRAASAWAEPLQQVSACSSGCSHCCHIPVTITRVEADLLARAAGRKASTPAQLVDLAEQTDPQSALQALDDQLRSAAPGPCPFLSDGRCSVYDARPLACRVLLNLDDDDLLCRLVDGAPIPVPYADSRQLKGLYLLAQPGAQLADIRDFFPS